MFLPRSLTIRSRFKKQLRMETLEQRQLLAVDVVNAFNLNLTNPWATIESFTSIGNNAYFVASEPGESNIHLWVTQGSPETTTKLVSLGPNDGQNRWFTNVQGTLYFRGFSEARGHELWKSNGTVATTMMVKDLTPGPSSSTISDLREHQGKLFFVANGHLTRSDGTAGGTFRLVDLLPDIDDQVQNLTSVNTGLFFTAKGPGNSRELYRTNGTAVGTAKITAVPAGNIAHLTKVGNELFFARNKLSLWKTSDSGANTTMVKDLSNGGGFPYQLTDVSGTLFFASGESLWKSDGTSDGTVEIKIVGGDLDNFFNFNGTLYFSGGSVPNGNGAEPWKSDGTTTGTVMIKDLTPGFNEGYADSSYPRNWLNHKGKLYFIAANAIWNTNGSAAGTIALEQGFMRSMTSAGDHLFLSSSLQWNSPVRLMKRNPDVAQAAIEIIRPGPGSGDASPSAVVEFNGALFFAGSDGFTGQELWKFENDQATLVKDIFPGPNGSFISGLTSVGSRLFFNASGPVGQSGLWTSDGSTAGTVFLKNVRMGATPGEPFLTQVGDFWYFRGGDTEGWELWKTDGTVSGTVRVRDIYPGTTYEYGYGFFKNSSSPSGLVNFQGTLYFAATDAAGGRELWKSDGTESGTVVAVDLWPGFEPYSDYVYSSGVNGLVLFKDAMYFSARNENGSGLWRSDGTPEGTSLVKGQSPTMSSPRGMTIVGNDLFFAAYDSVVGEELWKSDGTTDGTQRVRDIRPGSPSSQLQNITNVNGTAFFTADDGMHGRELWQSDGTAAGTRLVRDIYVGSNPNNSRPYSSDPTNLTNLNGVLFFSANNGIHGRELWRTHGTAPGASLAANIQPGAASSNPAEFSVINNVIYFSANSPLGREVWQASSRAPVLNIPSTVLNYREGTPPLRLAPTGTLADADTPILRGGMLTAELLRSFPGDRLVVRPSGNITVNGRWVEFHQVIIGSISGGSNGQPLRIDLNHNATLAATNELLRSLAYDSTSQNPAEQRRRISIRLFDGEGAVSNARIVPIDVERVNNRPTISDSSGPVEYLRNSPHSIRVAPNAIVQDPDNHRFPGGTLTIQAFGGQLATNRIELKGTLFSIGADNRLRRNGVEIGSVNAEAGIGGTPFVVTFNNEATIGFVQQLIRNIGFRTVGSTSSVARTVRFTLNDGSGGTSVPLNRTVNIT